MDKLNLNKIKELREKTGISILECKNALINTNYNIEEAIEYLKKKNIFNNKINLTKKTMEGSIYLTITQNKKIAVISEVNCETDFVAKSDDFQNFLHELNNFYIFQDTINTTQNINIQNIPEEIEKKRLNLINKLGENINIKRIKKFILKTNFLYGYMHNINKNCKIASLLIINNFIDAYEYLYLDIAMQITAMNPTYIDIKNIPENILNIENQSPENLNNFIKNYVLLEQPYIKDNKKQLKTLIKNNFEIIDFIRYEVGEIFTL